MSYKVITIKAFDRQAKRLLKKFPSFKDELIELIHVLEKNPEFGISMGNNCYKIRLSVSSKGKGKSGGTRVITHFYVLADTVILLSVYDKSEQGSITQKQINTLLRQIPF